MRGYFNGLGTAILIAAAIFLGNAYIDGVVVQVVERMAKVFPPTMSMSPQFLGQWCGEIGTPMYRCNYSKGTDVGIDVEPDGYESAGWYCGYTSMHNHPTNNNEIEVVSRCGAEENGTHIQHSIFTLDRNGKLSIVER